MRKRKNQRFDVFVYLFLAVFYFWMASRIPYTHDDWDWGLPVGIQQFLTASVNSRYVGNFFVILMTRSEFLKTLIMGAGYFLLPYTISVTAFPRKETHANRNRLICFVIANVLFLSMDRKIWQQTYGWVAGYSNFVISALFLLMIMGQGLTAFDQIDLSANKITTKSLALFFLGAASQLFIENIAVFLFAFSILIGLIYYKRTAVVSKEYSILAAGTTIGLIIMFSSGIYQSLWNTGSAVDGYRELHINANTSMREFLYSCYLQIRQIPYHIWENNLMICLAVLALMNTAFLYGKYSGKGTCTGCVILNSVFIVYYVSNYFLTFVSNTSILFLINAAFFLTIAAEIVLLYRDNVMYMCKLLLVWISVPAVIAPLIITSELGSRLCLTSNAIMILFVAMLLKTILVNVSAHTYRHMATNSLILLLILFTCHAKIYYEIGSCKDQRNAIIAQSIETGADTIVLPQYPHYAYLWRPDPEIDVRMDFFKEFYGIPQEATVIFD